MEEDILKINPPIFLVSTNIFCWRCGSDMPAVAIVAPDVQSADGEICVLSDIIMLPDEVFAFIQKRFPSFKLTFSKTTQNEYYANTCPSCGMLSGDFYLHSEPGAPFFPTSEKEAKHLIIQEIPLNYTIEVNASFGMGVGDLIMSCAKKI